jgi:hypothetical protein
LLPFWLSPSHLGLPLTTTEEGSDSIDVVQWPHNSRSAEAVCCRTQRALSPRSLRNRIIQADCNAGRTASFKLSCLQPYPRRQPRGLVARANPSVCLFATRL